MGEILDFAIMMDIIKKSGSWFSYDGNRLAQGKDNVKKLLEDNPEFAAEIENKVREMSAGSSILNEEEFELDGDDEDDFDIRTVEDDE
jgi:recombination protein RecA